MLNPLEFFKVVYFFTNSSYRFIGFYIDWHCGEPIYTIIYSFSLTYVYLQHSHPQWKIISLPPVITALWNTSPVFRPSPPADIPPCPSTCWGKRTLTGWMVFPSYGNSLPLYQMPLPTGRLCSPPFPHVSCGKSERQSSSVITPSDGIVLGFTVPSLLPPILLVLYCFMFLDFFLWSIFVVIVHNDLGSIYIFVLCYDMFTILHDL